MHITTAAIQRIVDEYRAGYEPETIVAIMKDQPDPAEPLLRQVEALLNDHPRFTMRDRSTDSYKVAAMVGAYLRGDAPALPQPASQPEPTPPSEFFEVYGSHGRLYCDKATGEVIRYDREDNPPEEGDYGDILCVDLAEYREWIEPSVFREAWSESCDILNIGFWNDKGEYESAEPDHRDRAMGGEFDL